MSDLIEKLKNEINLIDQSTNDNFSILDQKNNYIGLDWEIGLGIASSNGETAPTPFITLVFKSIDYDGNVQKNTVSLTPQQFNNFAQNVIRIQKSISFN